MPAFLSQIAEFIDSPVFGTIQIATLSYIGLLWVGIIIWVTRDAINRSQSLLFQTFSILINIAMPVLGLLFYLIVRPTKTNMERYYEDLERRLLLEGSAEKSLTCEKCLTLVEKTFTFCPSCGFKLKKFCPHCNGEFLSQWNICPHCGGEYGKPKKDELKMKVKSVRPRRLIAHRNKLPEKTAVPATEPLEETAQTL
ncbi:zinc ribbon domain-containing protein [Candidatus Peregrinibacteria bacterium]|nr:zinc ribbon domain-containing protein [Candidatus Peregrinibacteria bacterium]